MKFKYITVLVIGIICAIAIACPNNIEKQEKPVESEIRAVFLDKDESTLLVEKATKIENLGEPNVQVIGGEKEGEDSAVGGVRISTQLLRLHFDDFGGKLPGGGSLVMTTSCSGSCGGSCGTGGCNPVGNTCTPLICKQGCTPSGCTKTTTSMGNKGLLKLVFPGMPELDEPPIPLPPRPE